MARYFKRSPDQLGPENIREYRTYSKRHTNVFAQSGDPGRNDFQAAAADERTIYPFDHTTILSTLRAQFGLSGPLTPRDGAEGATLRSGLEPSQQVQDWVNAIGKEPGRPAPPKSPEEDNELLAERLAAKKTQQTTDRGRQT